MLTEQQQSDFRAEEEFRFLVRQQLEKQANKNQSKIWKFLNSPLGLWFLSSIVLSGIAFAYSGIQDWRDRNAAEYELSRRLDVEIQTRILNCLNEIDHWQDPNWMATNTYKAKIVSGVLDTETVLEDDILHAYLNSRDAR